MNIKKFTQKSLEATQKAEELTYKYGNSEVDQEHLLYALLDIDDSLISGLIEKMGISIESFKKRIEELINFGESRVNIE